ncbi:hypothetical protein [Ferrimicrobium sp.]|uniref:hypothetical protein n=1 Tax=Ferrimicrobium sp. TaxID=2926050 RepID=UPI00260E83E7|nr:hypothetical protein [Ferrimicrobium sp.]
MARRGDVLASLRPSVLMVRALRRVFEYSRNRWVVAGGFAVYVLLSLTKGRLSRRFLAPHQKATLRLDEGVSYLISAKQRSRT